LSTSIREDCVSLGFSLTTVIHAITEKTKRKDRNSYWITTVLFSLPLSPVTFTFTRPDKGASEELLPPKISSLIGLHPIAHCYISSELEMHHFFLDTPLQLCPIVTWHKTKSLLERAYKIKLFQNHEENGTDKDL